MKTLEAITFNELFVINVDVQNDFAGNRMYPYPKLGIAGGEEVVPPLNEVNTWARAKNGKVIFTGDKHKKGSKHFKAQGGPWDEHCMEYTAGAAFLDDLEILPGDTIAYKGTGMEDDGYSGWGADLELTSPLYVRDAMTGGMGDATTVGQAIEKAAWRNVAVVVGGLATDYCVKATVMDGLESARRLRENRNPRNIGIFVLRDAVRAVNVQPGDGDLAMAEMEAAGAIMITSNDLVQGRVLQVAA